MAANFNDKELWEIKNLPFTCQNNHQPVETISTDVMKKICIDHTPVYMFGSVDDSIFQKYHLNVS